MTAVRFPTPARTLCLAALCLSVLSVVPLRAETTPPKSEIKLALEIGFDQATRRYFRPRLDFVFPVGSSRVFVETTYEQRLNSRLQGEADFWLKFGTLSPLGSVWDLELSFNHMSRHDESRFQPYVLSINELIARLWWKASGVRLGFGLGDYLQGFLGLFNGTKRYSSLAVVDVGLPRIFGSEFSLSGEFKFVNFSRILHEIELKVGLSKTIYLFARNTTTYEYRNMTYLGLGLQSDSLEDTAVSYIRSRTDILPSDDDHKLVVNQLVLFDFVRTPERRLTFKMETDLPILRGREFWGVFRPSWLQYPLELEYERTLGRSLYLFGYCLYELVMTIDTAHAYSTKLGVGLGLRNQRIFQALLKPLRYEVSGGLNFNREYDARLALGLNTVRSKLNFGGEVTAHLNSQKETLRAAVFSEFGGPTKIRLYLGVDTTHYERRSNLRLTRFWMGFEFSRLFRDDS